MSVMLIVMPKDAFTGLSLITALPWLNCTTGGNGRAIGECTYTWGGCHQGSTLGVGI